ncbi:MAG: hypothetical protein IJ309_06495 [Clostridia bacterium]|nr:hypothetical protein [Clostridia bacterium]
MARLYFLRRTQYEVDTYQGDVFFEINGRCAGKLALCDAFVDVPAGTYHIRMYKTHMNSLVGFAELPVTVSEQEELLLQYLMPQSLNLPGHILVSQYSPAHAEGLIASINAGYYRDQQVKQNLKNDTERSNRTWITWIIVICVVLPAISFLGWLAYDLWLYNLIF